MRSVFSIEYLSYSLIVENSSALPLILSRSQAVEHFRFHKSASSLAFKLPSTFIAIPIEIDRRLPTFYLEQLWVGLSEGTVGLQASWPDHDT